MNTYCDDCKRCTGGCMVKSEVEGDDHNRCSECEAKLQARIEALEWLVEVQSLRLYYSYVARKVELDATLAAARAAAGV